MVDVLRGGSLGCEVQGQVGDGVAGPQEDVVALVLNGFALVVLRGRDVAEVDGTRAHGVELGVVTGEGLVDQLVDLRLVLAPVVLVGDQGHLDVVLPRCVGGELVGAVADRLLAAGLGVVEGRVGQRRVGGVAEAADEVVAGCFSLIVKV